jgi:hypothetical protein
MIGWTQKSRTGLPGERLLHRIAALTLGFGLAAATAALAMQRLDWAKGLFGGAVLGWLNFRWLSRGIRATILAASPEADVPADGAEGAATPVRSRTSAVAAQLAMVFRYALVAAGVYVIFVHLHVPVISIGLGLCALVAAILAASVWEVLKPES